jgi:hypothetical protein
MSVLNLKAAWDAVGANIREQFKSPEFKLIKDRLWDEYGPEYERAFNLSKLWYVVCDRDVSDCDSAEDRDEMEIWTLSRNPNYAGWNTDGGYSGYGLTKADADFLATAANEKIARDAK